MNDRNTLIAKRHDLMQYRSDALDKAAKAFSAGGDQSQYDAEMAKVQDYNKQLEQVNQLIGECEKSFPDLPLDDTQKGVEQRAEKSGKKLLDSICGTEKYADAWAEALAKGVKPDKGCGIESLAPLYEAE